MPYLLLVIAAVIMAIGFAKLGGSGRPSRIPWAPLLVWAVLLVTGISIWVSSNRIG